jgi:hypothetical protein
LAPRLRPPLFEEGVGVADALVADAAGGPPVEGVVEAVPVVGFAVCDVDWLVEELVSLGGLPVMLK